MNERDETNGDQQDETQSGTATTGNVSAQSTEDSALSQARQLSEDTKTDQEKEAALEEAQQAEFARVNAEKEKAATDAE